MSNGLGATYGLEPVACLTASATELVLSGPLGNFHIPRAGITKLGRAGLYPWCFNGVRIHHKNPKWPDELQFKSLATKSRAILSQLKTLGYPVR